MHRRTAVNRRAKVGSPLLCHPFTAVRLCVCSPFAILLALQGAGAQLGEHLVCNQGVRGSNPLRSMLRSAGSAASSAVGPFYFPHWWCEFRCEFLQGDGMAAPDRRRWAALLSAVRRGPLPRQPAAGPAACRLPRAIEAPVGDLSTL